MTDPIGLFDTKGKALIAVCYMPVIHPAHRALKPKTLAKPHQSPAATNWANQLQDDRDTSF